MTVLLSSRSPCPETRDGLCHLPPLLCGMNFHTCRPPPFCFVSRSLDAADRAGTQTGNSRFPVASGKLPNVGEKPRTPFLLLSLVFLQSTDCLALCLCQLLSGDSQNVWWGFWRLSGAASVAHDAPKRSTPSYLALAVSRELCGFSIRPNASSLGVPAGRRQHPEG